MERNKSFQTHLLNEKSKEIILKVLNYMEAEKNKKDFLIPVDKVQERAATATGFCLDTIKKIVAEKRRNDVSGVKSFKKLKQEFQIKNPTRDLHKNATRNVVNELCEKKKNSTVTQITARFGEVTGCSSSRDSVEMLHHKTGFRQDKKAVVVVEKEEKPPLQDENIGLHTIIKEESTCLFDPMSDHNDIPTTVNKLRIKKEQKFDDYENDMEVVVEENVPDKISFINKLPTLLSPPPLSYKVPVRTNEERTEYSLLVIGPKVEIPSYQKGFIEQKYTKETRPPLSPPPLKLLQKEQDSRSLTQSTTTGKFKNTPKSPPPLYWLIDKFRPKLMEPCTRPVTNKKGVFVK